MQCIICTRSLKIVPSRTPALTPRKILHIMYMLIFLFQLYFNFASFHYLMDRLFYFGKMSISRIRRRKIFSSQNCNILNHQIRLMSPIITENPLVKLPYMDNMNDMIYSSFLSNFGYSSMKAAKERFLGTSQNRCKSSKN